LEVPETRLKPEVAGVDGVITTFFGPGYYNYPFALFGTSASAASVAGVVALMLQEAGGPGSLNVATVKLALENSAQPRTSTPEMTQALGAGSAGFVSVTAVGQVYFGLNYFTVNYFGFFDDSMESLTIDGSGAGLVFDTTSSAFAIGNTIGLNASDVQVEPISNSTSKFTLKFKPGSFKSRNSISFTLGQDVAGKFTGFTQGQFEVGSEAEDLASGATFTANFAGEPEDRVHGRNVEAVRRGFERDRLIQEAQQRFSRNRQRGAFQNGSLTFGYSPFDGFGLINAEAAVEAVFPAHKRLSQQ
jgi:hypothetical protein